ncbi:hypothetical protein SAMN05216189_10116 [Pseudomonas delhiensis]|uniref:Uncharacterized protein n=1 Tax=Pseudomonas delhiensis TaxID=366289 RepID=A0A239K0X9_9PSED|nr:hypothetical protein [Pseudomonas delhiensis]SDI97458.1 hypothetical protein SAMN05216189_10116 [Pseudomonas delhiensis]SNT10714.1 hypothetical protein SAMN06295949_1146 [Pseudomonas delhiensis]
MPVRLDNIPAPTESPSPPSLWVWLALLVLFLMVGFGLTLVLSQDAAAQDSTTFWRTSLGIPLLIWGGLLVVRLMVWVLQQGQAEGFNEQRFLDLSNRLRQGRRSLQIVASSFYSAAHEGNDGGTAGQIEALLSNRSALKSQPARGREEMVYRHSQLPAALVSAAQSDEETYLLGLYRRVLSDLAKPLSSLPTTQPLALLLETECALTDEHRARVWARAWRESGITQEVVAVKGTGLAAIDHWLDTRSNDPALLLVVAMRLASGEQDGTAETAVGLLLSNRQRQGGLIPRAYLHRPEQERTTTADDLLYAAQQALTWVPLPVAAVEHVWLSGIAPTRQPDITKALLDLPCLVKPGLGLYDLGASLGHAGCAAPWIAIASATEAAGINAKPQFIVSGAEDATQMLWCTTLTGVPPSSK